MRATGYTGTRTPCAQPTAALCSRRSCPPLGSASAPTQVRQSTFSRAGRAGELVPSGRHQRGPGNLRFQASGGHVFEQQITKSVPLREMPHACPPPLRPRGMYQSVWQVANALLVPCPTSPQAESSGLPIRLNISTTEIGSRGSAGTSTPSAALRTRPHSLTALSWR